MKPKHITVHCSASKEGVTQTAKDIERMHKQRGFRTIGYHKVIRLDGCVELGRPINQQGAHVYGNNRDNIGICLIGGLDKNGKAKDTFSFDQKYVLFCEIVEYCEEYNIPFSNVCGHRDYSPDLNGDGVITPNEFIKQCPCFDVKSWFKETLIEYGYIKE